VQVTCIDNALRVSVPLNRKAALRKKKDAGDPGDEEAADNAVEEETYTQVR
jgi:hypothetical protein